MSTPSFTWIVKGTSYDINDPDTLCKVLGYKGFGMPPLHRLRERGPMQHGETDYGYRFDPRNMILVLGIIGEDLDDLITKRQTLINIFKPRDNQGSFRFTMGSFQRQIDADVVDGLQMDERDVFFQKCAVALDCGNPFWYEPTALDVSLTLGASSNFLEVPITVPMVVGSSTLNTSHNIVYTGSAETFPVITIQGPITDPVIEHVQTGYKLDFTGITIDAGDYYEIDLRYGSKTIVDSAGTRKLEDLDDDESDLVLISILPSPEVTGGINTIKVTGTAADQRTQVTFVYYMRHLGF
jgi:hypothetical protein